jgi:hypothetical protein
VPVTVGDGAAGPAGFTQVASGSAEAQVAGGARRASSANRVHSEGSAATLFRHASARPAHQMFFFIVRSAGRQGRRLNCRPF